MDKKIENKNRIRKLYLIPLTMVILLVLISFIVLKTDTSDAFRVNKDMVTIKEVRQAPFQDFIFAHGQVEPVTMIYLDAIEGGIVEDIYLEEGAMVEKGDSILALSNLNLSLNILNSEALLAEKTNFLRETQINMEQQKLSIQRELLNLNYDLVRMKRKHEQNTKFYHDKLIAKEEFLETEEAYKLALKLHELTLKRNQQDSVFRKNQIQKISRNLKSMERNLELIYKRKDHLKVKAPVKGQLAYLSAVPGQSIMQGQRLGQVNVLTNYKLVAQIDEHYIDRVETGLQAHFERENKTYYLELKKIHPQVREGNFMVELHFKGDSPDNIRSGQTYAINLELGKTQNAILLSRGGFFQSSGGQWVYVLSEDGKEAYRRKIKIGRQNPEYYEVLQGLEDGEKVIISAYEIFGDSEKLLLD